MRKWRSHLGQTFRFWSRSFFQMIWRHWSHLTQRPSVLTRFSPEASISACSRLNHAMVVPSVAERSDSCRRLVLNATLRFDALGVSVLHFLHLGDGIGDFDDAGMRVAPGEDDVHHLRPFLEGGD